MIASFKDEETRKIFLTGKSKRFSSIARTAARRLGDIDSAQDLAELKNLPGNHLERLKGDRGGQWSIRVNDQFRGCFEWNGKDAVNVEVVDYHRGDGDGFAKEDGPAGRDSSWGISA